MSIEFFAAAKTAELGPDEDYITITIEGEDYQARRPTTAQLALVVATGGKDIGVIYRVLGSILPEDAVIAIEGMVWDRRIDLGDLFGGSEQNPKGLLGQIVEEFREGNPTQPSTGSSKSRPTGGQRSTGRSPGAGSTHSS